MMMSAFSALLAVVSIAPGPDVSAAFDAAVERAKRHGGETVVLERGEYHFPVGTAHKMEFFISNHDQSPFHLVNLPLAGVTNLTVRGNGATLVFHGATIGAAIVDSANVRFENLKMDWSRPFVTEMKVLGFADGKTIGTIDERLFPFDIEDGKIVAKGEGWRTPVERCMAFRGDTHEIVERTCDVYYRGQATRDASGRLVCAYDFGKLGLRPGDVVALRPSLRPRPACVIHRSADTAFEDVAIHTAWGMGVICQMSENFAWRGTGRADGLTSGVFPPVGSGRVTTLHADASHFSNVKGAVVIENCLFETMMDDAINVHSTCLGIVKVEGARRIRCRYMHEQAVGFGVFAAGDRLRFIAGRTLENGGELRVVAVETHDAREISLTLSGDVPAGYGVGDAVENADYQPTVIFRGNTVRNNRARGALFTTPGRVVVENNLFDHVSGAAILFAGDAQGWYESGACTDVLVAGNVFRDCLTSRYQFCDGIISSWPMVREPQSQKRHYHRNIRIARNVFETFDAPILFAKSTDDLVFSDDNVIRRNAHYRSWGMPPFSLKDCDRAVLPKSDAGDPSAKCPLEPAAPTAVHVSGGLWYDRLETNRLSTLRACFAKCNETPRIANITNAANRAHGLFGGSRYDDSDVFKVMEGAAYVLAQHPDKELEDYMDWLIGQVGRAQEPDGYLYTARTLGYPPQPDGNSLGQMKKMGSTRWSFCSESHELYNVGHMYEAAVAWYRATGKRNFLDIAEKNAALVCRTFGWGDGQLRETPGHQEIELALCKLYRATGKRQYLDQAKFFLDMRGRKDIRFDPSVCKANFQDHVPVVGQDEAIGHAVRAGYMYSAMVDVATLLGDAAYGKAVSRLWDDVVGRKLYLTGGIGARMKFTHPQYGLLTEGFNGPYDLPNDAGEAYLESCAAIANVLWNQRMFLASGESRYVDILELGLHNAVLAGIALSGDRFFYPNPLASKGGYARNPWFSTSCCPVNDVRLLPQVPSFAYASDGAGTLYWNLFLPGTATVGGVNFKVETDYPWKGDAKLTVLKASDLRTLKVRIPGWAIGRPVPSDLYAQVSPASFGEVVLSVNGRAVNGCPGKDGYVDVTRAWLAGDVVTLDLPMTVRRVRAHSAVRQDAGRLAVMCGPILYCAEGADNGGRAYDAVLPAGATFERVSMPFGDRSCPALRASSGLVLIPYCLWGNRQPGNEMQCWLRTDGGN